MVSLHHKIPGPRGRFRTAGVVACMVVAAGLLPACSSEDSSEPAATQAAATKAASPIVVDAEQLNGTWFVGGPMFLTYVPDGTWYVVSKTYHEDGTVSITRNGAEPWAWGTYTFDGSTVTMNESPDATECPNSHGAYTVDWIDADTLRMVLIDENCDTRRYDQHAAMKHARVTEQSSES